MASSDLTVNGLKTDSERRPIISPGTTQPVSGPLTNSVTLEYGINFQTGLAVVSTGTWDYTLVYE